MISYHAMHHSIWRARGKASAHPCAAGCGRAAEHWAYDGKDPDEVWGWSNQSRDRRQVRVRYSLKLERYQPLCRPCHTKLDSRPRPVSCPKCGCTFTPGESAPKNKGVTEW